jgi:xylan 1,4-beta-xylosidase
MQSNFKTSFISAVFIVTCSFLSGFSAQYNLTVNGAARQGSVPHFWSQCIGTGTMWYCQKPAWRTAAKIAAAEAGFKMVRGHGLLTGTVGEDYIGIFHWSDTTKPPTYNWVTFDSIFDFIIDTCKMAPLIELDFMPKDLQKNGPTGKPKSWAKWRDLVYNIVTHCESRYGQEFVRTWFFEVWNEYDIAPFWKGTVTDYDSLYMYAAEGALAADSLIRIGGPVGSNPNDLQPFATWCDNHKVKYTFLSNHDYAGMDAVLTATADPIGLLNNNKIRSNVIKGLNKKVYNLQTEWNSSYAGTGGRVGTNTISMDSHTNAPLIVKTMKLFLDSCGTGKYLLPDVFSYWALSDCFNEYQKNDGQSYIEQNNYIPFGQVFGLINYQGVRKAAFNAFKLLNMMGTIRLPLTGGCNISNGADGFATMNSDSTQVQIIVYNFYNTLGLSGSPNKIDLTVNDLPLPHGQISMTHFRIDSLHSSAYSAWLRLNKPVTPSPAQWDTIKAASEIAVLKQTEFNYTGTAFTDTFTLPQQSVSMLLFKVPTSTSIQSQKSTPVKQQSPSLSITGSIVTTGKPIGELKVAIFTLNGKMVSTIASKSGLLNLDIISLNKGVYLICAQSGHERVVSRYIRSEM